MYVHLHINTYIIFIINPIFSMRVLRCCSLFLSPSLGPDVSKPRAWFITVFFFCCYPMWCVTAVAYVLFKYVCSVFILALFITTRMHVIISLKLSRNYIGWGTHSHKPIVSALKCLLGVIHISFFLLFMPHSMIVNHERCASCNILIFITTRGKLLEW